MARAHIPLLIAVAVTLSNPAFAHAAPALAEPPGRVTIPVGPPRPLPEAATSDACRAPAPGREIPFAPGERLDFQIDSLGVTVGYFSLALAPGRSGTGYSVLARAKTDTFAANFYDVLARAQAELGPKLESRGYSEDATEGGVHRTTDILLPPPAPGSLRVLATREGKREDYDLTAPADTRDLLSALYAARGMPFELGREVCVPVFGARRLWTLRMTFVAREPVTTPAGTFRTLHLEGTAVRTDRPDIRREVHLWLADDPSRTPVAAFGMVQGKPVRAQLVSFDPGKRRVAQSRAR